MDKKVLLGLALTLAIALFIPIYWLREPARQQAAILRQRHEASVHGAELFILNCAVCHGAKGEGLVGPALRETRLEPDMLRRIISRGAPGTAMPPWSVAEGGSLKEHQVEGLVTFIRFWEDGVLAEAKKELEAHVTPTPAPTPAALPTATETAAPPPSPTAAPTPAPTVGPGTPTPEPPPTPTAPPATPTPTPAPQLAGDPIKGQAIYSSISPPCAACHGAQGEGGFAPALKGTALTAEQMAAQVRRPRAAMPAYLPDKLSDADLAHVIAFIQTLK